MDQDVIATHLENLDRRLTKVEQILPTLATKEDLKAYPTKEDLKAYATRVELRREVQDEGERSRRHADQVGKRVRRHMKILIEEQRGDIRLLAEHLAVAMSKLSDR